MLTSITIVLEKISCMARLSGVANAINNGMYNKEQPTDLKKDLKKDSNRFGLSRVSIFIIFILQIIFPILAPYILVNIV